MYTCCIVLTGSVETTDLLTKQTKLHCIRRIWLALNYKKVKLTSQYLSLFLRPISSLLAEIWLENTHNTLHGLIIV